MDQCIDIRLKMIVKNLNKTYYSQYLKIMIVNVFMITYLYGNLKIIRLL